MICSLTMIRSKMFNMSPTEKAKMITKSSHIQKLQVSSYQRETLHRKTHWEIIRRKLLRMICLLPEITRNNSRAPKKRSPIWTSIARSLNLKSENYRLKMVTTKLNQKRIILSSTVKMRLSKSSWSKCLILTCLIIIASLEVAQNN